MNLHQFLNKNKTANPQSIPQDAEEKAVEPDVDIPPTLDEIDSLNSSANLENDVVYIPIAQLHPMANNPYNLYSGEKLDEFVESIKEKGILTPLIVRPKDNAYEIIAGHNRRNGGELAGLTELPCIIKNVSDDEAIILAIDSNIQRETILPSEKAWAYRFKMEALKRQGKRTDLTLSQIETKLNSAEENDVNLTSTQFVSKLRTDEIIAQETGDSREKIRRYIRLTELYPPLLKMVDEGTIPITVGVELSYISLTPQQLIHDVLNGKKDYSIDIKKAEKLRELDAKKYLTLPKIMEILKVQKLERDPKTTKPSAQIRKFFPAGTKAKEIEKIIIELLEKHYQQNKEIKNDE